MFTLSPSIQSEVTHVEGTGEYRKPGLDASKIRPYCRWRSHEA